MYLLPLNTRVARVVNINRRTISPVVSGGDLSFTHIMIIWVMCKYNR